MSSTIPPTTSASAIGRESLSGLDSKAVSEATPALPPHYRPEQVEGVWRVDYETRAADAERWAEEHGIRPAAEDQTRICLLFVDCQNTFCTPGFELFVPGAPDDSRRLCEFLYRNLEGITQIVPTLDSHQALQIFHSAWLVGENDRHPPPYTLVTAADIEQGIWRAASPEHQRHLAHYTQALEEGGKYQLTVWPYHAMLGGIGHALVSALEEAVFFHSVARRSAPDFHVKGTNPLTEHYSVLGPEVTTGPDGEAIAKRDFELVERLRGFDAVVVAGQAKSHCVAWTIDDLLEGFGDLAPKVYLLEDCTSPVVVPGAVDYTEQADNAFRRFAEAGMHVVRSTEPMAGWPGMPAR
jgi:nicotinamidase-related amidase